MIGSLIIGGVDLRRATKEELDAIVKGFPYEEIIAMRQFKVGQKIRCVDASPHGCFGIRPAGSENSILKRGAIYTVKSFNKVSNTEVFLEEVKYSWGINRFIAYDPTAPAVNDYVCKRCKENRCSKSEKACWKCGEPIVP